MSSLPASAGQSPAGLPAPIAAGPGPGAEITAGAAAPGTQPEWRRSPGRHAAGGVSAAAGAVGATGAIRAPGAAGEPLAVEQLSVRYGDCTAVDRVSLAVAEGSVYALLGRNGSGKSSLVRCLLGQQRPTAGRTLLFGQDAWRRRAALMAAVGVVAEQPDAPLGCSPRALARFCRSLYPRWDGAGYEARLRRFGVPSDLPFGRLSKGQQRQVALALALAGHPRLLILDDPTLGLDVVAKQAFFDELIGELADRGVTVFLTTHELGAVERLAERVGILAGGRLLLDEDLESLKRRFRRIWLPAAPAAAGTAADRPAAGPAPSAPAPLRQVIHEWGTEVLVGDYDPGRAAHAASGPSGGAAEVTPLTLEEIFVALVGGGESQPAAAAAGGAR
jgi:ABC-2 type transport system ATP-binding protein